MRRAATILLAALIPAGQAWASGAYETGVAYYFERFDPAMRPWNPGQALNIEEVFKNYQYYEILFDSTGTRLTVNRHIQGSKTETGHYRVAPDGGLEKDD